MQNREKILENFESSYRKLDIKGDAERLNDAVEHVMNQSGKRIRPMLCLLAAQSVSENIAPVLNPAMAIEVFHNFTLVHDDIMDNAAIRRGKPSVFASYGRDTAILAGDVMLVKSFEILFSTNSDRIFDIGKLFSRAAIEVCEGQQIDLDFESGHIPSMDEYLTMIRKKTAVLLAASLQIGAYAGSGDRVLADRFYDIGIQLGLSFQLQDDLLDVYAKDDKFGKMRGGDIIQNKMTYLMIKALELADQDQHRTLSELVQSTGMNGAEKVAAVVEIFNKLDIKSATVAAINGHYNSGLAMLHRLASEGHDTSELEAYIVSLQSRNY